MRLILTRKDSHRHRAPGRFKPRWFRHSNLPYCKITTVAEPDLSEILARLAPVDLVLVEGYKSAAHPKIEVHRQAAGHALIQPATRISAPLPPIQTLAP